MITHIKLVKKARAWLLRRYGLVISEMAAGSEQADAIGLGGDSTLIECKASRSDFLADLRKSFRHYPDSGMGDNRYYFAPRGLIKPDELQSGWGLLELDGQRIYKSRESEHFKKDYRAEIQLLVSAIRRLDIPRSQMEGMSVKFYSIQTKNRATVLSQYEASPAAGKLIQEFPKCTKPTP